jgi:hypothetical protein
MDKEKKEKIRPIVREVMSQKVGSLINDDIFMDNDVRERVWDKLPDDLMNDKEVEKCLLDANDGACVSEVCEAFIDTLTNAFMGRFES